MIWFTSDLHIGHAKIAELRADATSSWHLDDIAGHDNTLAANWDDRIRPEDQVWILGDISAGGSGAQHSALEWLDARPGHKHLITGNHDGPHPMNRDAHRWQNLYLGGAFESVQAFARRKIAGRSVLLSHFPYTGDHTTDDRYTQYRLRDCGTPLLHGHTHSTERVSRAGTLQIHLGLDAWNLTPVSLDEIAQTVSDSV